jgi:hypothetical protein
MKARLVLRRAVPMSETLGVLAIAESYAASAAEPSPTIPTSAERVPCDVMMQVDTSWERRRPGWSAGT